MPESVHSDVGINSWEPLSELVIVTRLAIGAPSLSHEISGHGEACRQSESDYITLFLTFTTIVLKHKKWHTSNWMCRRSVLPDLTTSKVFMLRSLNFGLTVTIQRLHMYTCLYTIWQKQFAVFNFQFLHRLSTVFWRNVKPQFLRLMHLLLHSWLQFEKVLTRRGHGCDAFVKAQRFSVTSVIGGNDPHPVRGHCP